MIQTITQLVIPLTACGAIWLLNRPSFRLRRWGPIVGLAGQPFWFVSTIGAEQWGIVVVAAWFTYVYCEATWRNWIQSQGS